MCHVIQTRHSKSGAAHLDPCSLNPVISPGFVHFHAPHRCQHPEMLRYQTCELPNYRTRSEERTFKLQAFGSFLEALID